MVSVAATVEFVTVKVVVCPAVVVVENSVICPVALLRVTPVVRFVNCVTVPPAPAPVAYPLVEVAPSVVNVPAAGAVPPIAGGDAKAVPAKVPLNVCVPVHVWDTPRRATVPVAAGRVIV